MSALEELVGLKSTIEEKLTELVGHEWQIRNGLTVPRTDDIVLRDGAVQLDAVYLYTDMMGSTRLVSEFAPGTAAKVTRAFINTACRVIRNRDGHIRSFDGDRVMGIFVGADKEGRAVRTALEITYATDKLVWPALERRLPSLTRQGFKLRHVSGVAAGPVFMARTGIYDHNDLISIGSAANVAAKLSDIREDPQYRSYITRSLYDAMPEHCAVTDGKVMWQAHHVPVNGEQLAVCRSNWEWPVT
ncbi:adenylate/guanylate cyclase domain-containing protein [Streptomyces sp. NPDC047061]|uniref:adenylate/guanylate cyclase domain-containing protein n=1 Tax=Streptomyces sp. NPDC047061 TaxID=3154605 RepID=UPI0034089E03